MDQDLLLSETCSNCGFPLTDCVCDLLNKSTQAALNVIVEKRRYRKNYTIVSGFDKDMDVKTITKTLKTKLACGGTFKNNKIEIQGAHKEKTIKILKEMGYKAN